MTTELRVHLLGEFRLYRDGVLTPAAAWHTRQARQVFKVLLAEYGRVVPAQRLQDLLWTETAEHPEKTLRSAVNALRAVLEPDRAPQQPSAFVPRGQRGYRLLVPSGHQLWVDVVAFEQELDQALAGATSDARETSCARLHAALARYTGDYLVEDGEATWVWPERERLRERYFVGVTQLVAWHRDAGQWAAALACAQQGLARDPLREALYAVSMQCQAQMGETAQALQTFERCRSVLARALGTNPSPMLLRLHAEILRGEQPTMGASAPQPILPQPLVPPTAPFIGRVAELAVVRQRLAAILPTPAAPITSRPFALAVGGAPGVGKTRFVDQVHQMVQETSVRSQTTRCFEVEQALPYAPVMSLLRQRRQTTGEDTPDALATIAPRLSATLAPVETTPGAISASATLARLIELMVALCERQALVLVVEDAHWADEATTLLLNRLLQQRTLPLLLLLTYCPEELEAAAPAARLLRTWRCDDHFQELHLEPFTPDELRAYLFAGQFPTEYSVAELAQGTGGNALLLGEALRLPRTNATAPTSEQVAPAPPLPERLAAAPAVRARLLARLARLSPLARRWAARAAILRRAFAPSWFGASVSAQDDDALGRLIAQGFLVEVRDQLPADACLALAHPIIGQVVINACPQFRLTRLRLEVAEALASLSTPLVEALAAEIAAHYHAAGRQAGSLAASGLALRYDVLAADVAWRESRFRKAARHSDAALATTARPGNHPVTSALGAFRLALMLCIMGHIDEGAQLVARLLTQMQALNDAAEAHTRDEHLLASLVTNLLHRSDQALRVALVAPLARAGAMAPTPLATPVAHKQQVGEAHEMRTRWAPFVPPMPFPALDLRTLTTMTDVDNTALLFSALGWATMLQGSTERAWAYIKAAMQTAKEAQLTSSVLAEISLIRMLFARGHAKEAFAWYHALESRVRAAPEMAWVLIWPQIDLSYRRIAASQLDEAERLLTRLQRDLPQQQDFVSHQHAIKIAHGLLALRRGQRERAQTLLSEAMAAPEQIYIEAYAQGEIALAHITADNGDASAAMERLQALLRFCGERGLLDLYCLIALEIAPLCDALGQPQDAQYLAQEVYRLASGAGLGAHRRTAARLLAPHRSV